MIGQKASANHGSVYKRERPSSVALDMIVFHNFLSVDLQLAETTHNLPPDPCLSLPNAQYIISCLKFLLVSITFPRNSSSASWLKWIILTSVPTAFWSRFPDLVLPPLQDHRGRPLPRDHLHRHPLPPARPHPLDDHQVDRQRGLQRHLRPQDAHRPGVRGGDGFTEAEEEEMKIASVWRTWTRFAQ